VRAFLYDTWAFVALADRRDPHHDLAVEADRLLEERGYVAATTDYIVDETLTLLNVAGGAKTATAFAEGLAARSEAQELLIAMVERERQQQALVLFKKLAPSDRRLSFTDCTSFAVMRELGCEIAFTADRHFRRAGGGIRPLFEWRENELDLVMPT
jgi:predicted nucleic acid-binding protein